MQHDKNFQFDYAEYDHLLTRQFTKQYNTIETTHECTRLGMSLTIYHPLQPEAVVRHGRVRLEPHVSHALAGGDRRRKDIGAAQVRADRRGNLVRVALLDLRVILERR